MDKFLRGLSKLKLGYGDYEWIDVDGEPTNDGTLRMIVLAPDDTPFANGLFMVTIKVPIDYPHTAPEAQFNTRIWHPLVEWSSGRLCHDYFREDWQAADGAAGLIERIRKLFYIKKVSSAVNCEASEEIRMDDGTYEKKVREKTALHAIDT
jgi:ubiquitin-conjugating enzyme E2 S